MIASLLIIQLAIYTHLAFGGGRLFGLDYRSSVLLPSRIT